MSIAVNRAVAVAEEEYRRRLEECRARHQVMDRRQGLFGVARFVVLMLGLVVVLIVGGMWWSDAEKVFSPWWLGWLLAPAAAFLALSWFFERARRQDQAALRAAAFYEAGLARLADEWAGRGVAGTEFLQEEHLYAADLDLFGKGSLFERLCEAQTSSGRATLARWLLAPASPEEVRERQQAVAELRDRLDWRERLALAASAARGVDTQALATWGVTPPENPPGLLSWAARLLAVLTVLALAGWGVGWLPLSGLLGVVMLQRVYALLLMPRVLRTLRGLDGRSRDVLSLSQILVGIERQPFTSPLLVRLQKELRTEGAPPSERLAQLLWLLELHDSARNSFFGMIAWVFLWTTQVSFAVEAWRRKTGPGLGRWLEVIGEVEALTSLAGYSYENPSDPFPEVVPGGPLFDAAGLGHPLLPRDRCVVNDVKVGEPVRLLIVSGSNMSGKSTFLRTVGVNAVLAQAGAPVRANRLRLSPLAVAATLRIQDSLQGGKSRFFAEITRLQKIVALAGGKIPVLFLLDELLHGTNSHDRRIGAEAVLRTLLDRGAAGLVTTHDLSLAQLAERLAPLAVNVHFSDELRDGTLHFDYKLRPGVVEHSNALALMRAVGLSVVPEAADHPAT